MKMNILCINRKEKSQLDRSNTDAIEQWEMNTLCINRKEKSQLDHYNTDAAHTSGQGKETTISGTLI